MKFKQRISNVCEIEMPDGEIKEFTVRYEATPWLPSHFKVVGEFVVIAYNSDDQDADHLLADLRENVVDAYNNPKLRKALYATQGYDEHGEKDLDAVWEAYEEEAIARYVKKVLTSYTLSELLELVADDEAQTKDEVAEALRADAVKACWPYVYCGETMRSVLSDMWEEFAYWPGDKYSVLLDVYDHSGQSWSIAGGGTQCRWDTSAGAGVWVPDPGLRKELEALSLEEAQKQCRSYADSWVSSWNDVLSGNIFGCCVETYGLDGQLVTSDDGWGYVGTDYAQKALIEEFFEPAVKAREA